MSRAQVWNVALSIGLSTNLEAKAYVDDNGVTWNLQMSNNRAQELQCREEERHKLQWESK